MKLETVKILFKKFPTKGPFTINTVDFNEDKHIKWTGEFPKQKTKSKIKVEPKVEPKNEEKPEIVEQLTANIEQEADDKEKDIEIQKNTRKKKTGYRKAMED